MARRQTDPPILLVEDKDSLRAMLRHALESQGHVVIEARDQNEAVEALRTGRPGLVSICSCARGRSQWRRFAASVKKSARAR